MDIDAISSGRYAPGMADEELETRRWKRVEYDRLIECGFFKPGEPVELLGGQLIVAEPQGNRHFTAIRAVEEALRAAFGQGWEVRGQGPIALDEESEPEPDIAVVQTSLPARAGRRGQRVEPRLRPRPQGQPLRARRPR